MSSHIVEVCEVKAIEPHPMADRLEICIVKGWRVCTGRGQFRPGDKCIYIPPNSILQAPIYRDRLNIEKYLAPLPEDEEGEVPPGLRVRACRMRGMESYGVIDKLRPECGDDPNWPVGTDVCEFLGITKYEPYVDEAAGEPTHPLFRTFTEIEQYQEFPDAIRDGTDVVITEKIHGMNARLALIIEDGIKKKLVGSCDMQLKEFKEVRCRFKYDEFKDYKFLTENGESWEAIDWDTALYAPLGRIFQIEEKGQYTYWQIFQVKSVIGQALGVIKAKKVRHTNKDGGKWEPVQERSMFWKAFDMLDYWGLLERVLNISVSGTPISSIILYGELWPSQDMKYGATVKYVSLFAISVNGRYLDYDDVAALCNSKQIPMVTPLYRGPFAKGLVDLYTSGPTTLCEPKDAGKFKGREGIVIQATKETINEALLPSRTNGRAILKSISVDYLDRKGGTELK